ncbi:MAG: phosphoribosylamine--glycine ligase [Bacteroidetes bacterium]|nr:phosphoribosylamine--glycine ligase [Bacteroidota bacterium]
MRILVLGNGGREHAIAWKLSQSHICEKLFIAPGNAGTAMVGENIDINIIDFQQVGSFCINNKIDLVFVGPEEPLVKGIADYFYSDERLNNILFIGPSAKGAMLEGSKDFAKQFMQRNNIPTAAYKSFSKGQYEEAIMFLESLKPPYVLKADGLAAGKGVVISQSLDEAKQSLFEMLELEKFGQASSTVVIEEFLDGIEVSVFVLTDGENYKILPSAKDYKRIGENDTGPNTGGMGAISPVPFVDQAFMNKVEERIIKPTVSGLKSESIKYCGFLFIGLMNVKGDPYVIEYNVRLGDPETEVVLPRIMSDFASLLRSAALNKLDEESLIICQEFAVTVMLVSGGYPGDYRKGIPIHNIEKVTGSNLFYAGIKQKDGNLVTNGGRVLAITSVDNSMANALNRSFANAETIDYEGKYYRKDIGKDLQ